MSLPHQARDESDEKMEETARPIVAGCRNVIEKLVEVDVARGKSGSNSSSASGLQRARAGELAQWLAVRANPASFVLFDVVRISESMA